MSGEMCNLQASVENSVAELIKGLSDAHRMIGEAIDKQYWDTVYEHTRDMTQIAMALCLTRELLETIKNEQSTDLHQR